MSRVSKTNAYEHMILGTQSYKPREFATQVMDVSAIGAWPLLLLSLARQAAL